MLKRIHYVSFDSHKKRMVAPDWVPIANGRLYFFSADSVEYAVQPFWHARGRGDDSKGLRVRGDSNAACDARSRWPSGLHIPVLEPGELDVFLHECRGGGARGSDPATDSGEQYGLLLENLLDFDERRRVYLPDDPSAVHERGNQT